MGDRAVASGRQLDSAWPHSPDSIAASASAQLGSSFWADFPSSGSFAPPTRATSNDSETAAATSTPLPWPSDSSTPVTATQPWPSPATLDLTSTNRDVEGTE